jgi:hypothetical protein
VGFALSSITIAIAWFFVRPLLGIALLVLAVAGVVWLLKVNRKKQVQQQGQAGAAKAA